MAQNVAQAAIAAADIVGATSPDVASAVEHHLATLADQGAPNINVVNAVSLKLPEFNPSRVEYWFLVAESEVRIKNITADLTKFSYVVSSMKGDVFDQVIDLVRAPHKQVHTRVSRTGSCRRLSGRRWSRSTRHRLARVGRPQAPGLVQQDCSHTSRRHGMRSYFGQGMFHSSAADGCTRPTIRQNGAAH
jgi:hypothetical protein